MPKFVIIEIDETLDPATQVHRVAELVEDGFISNLDAPRFEETTTINHQTLSDVVKAVMANDE